MEFLILFALCVMWARCEFTAIQINKTPLQLWLWKWDKQEEWCLKRLREIEGGMNQLRWGKTEDAPLGVDVDFWREVKFLETVLASAELVKEAAEVLEGLMEVDKEVRAWLWVWADGDCGYYPTIIECANRREPCSEKEIVSLRERRERQARLKLESWGVI